MKYDPLTINERIPVGSQTSSRDDRCDSCFIFKFSVKFSLFSTWRSSEKGKKGNETLRLFLMCILCL